MRVPRVAVDGTLSTGERVQLSAATAHHLLRVLRLPDGAAIQLFNGEAGDWVGRLRARGRRAAMVEVEEFVARTAESALDITLVQGLSRGQRMDYTLEKSVELGVATIRPVVMARSQAVPEGQRAVRKAAHWAGVVASAAAQSGRTRLPSLQPLEPFADWLAAAAPADHPHVLLDPAADIGARDLAPGPRRITLIAGPEGGFTPAEREAAFRAGCQGIRLGPRILRTETAAVAALALLQGLYGDL